MKKFSSISNVRLLVLGLTLMLGCEPRELADVKPIGFPNTPEVFIDGFVGDMAYAAFGGSDVRAFQVDDENTYNGTLHSMRFNVPDEGSPSGSYAGGVFYSKTGRNLSGFNAISFYVKASQPVTIAEVGFGNDLGANKYVVTMNGLQANTNWKKVIIPIPDASKLTAEKGLFHYAASPQNGRGYTFWIDEVRFENIPTLGSPVGLIFNGQDKTKADAETGDKMMIDGVGVRVNLPNGVNQTVNISRNYLSFTSSTPGVASVDSTGLISIADAGTATITAKLGANNAAGSLKITSKGLPVGPTTAAPTPTREAADVISMFSNAYQNVTIDTWNTRWQYSTAEEFFIKVSNNDAIRYKNLNFVGVEFSSQTINATAMGGFHIDIWTPDATTAPNNFKVLLVDFGPNGTIGGNDDVSHEVTIASPTLVSNNWVSLDIPFSSFTGLTSRAHLGQLVLSGSIPNLYVDNVYLYKIPTRPAVAAPVPTKDAANVLSIFSDTYTNVAGTNLNPNWGQATVTTETSIAGNNTLSMAGLNYQGMEFGSAVDASAMGFLHLDYYSVNSSLLKTFLISAGPVETPYTLTVPSTGWNSVDVPLSSFSPVALQALIQMKFEGNGDVYFDNVYFWKAPVSVTPTVAAPVPTKDAANVLSIFSDTYTNVAGTNLNPNWGQATVTTETPIAGNNTLSMAGLNYQGIEFGSAVNASAMGFLHIDYYTVNSTSFKTALISAGPVETPYTHTVPTTGWNSVDIPLSSFSPVALQALIQMKFEGNGDLYVDNIFFWKTPSASVTPTVAAPIPTKEPANVLSVFSDTYTNITGTDFNPNWGQATVTTQTPIAGNNTLSMAGLNYQGVAFGSDVNASAMGFLHIDYYTVNSTSFKTFLISAGPVETPYTHTVPTTGWNSVDIPLSSFSPVALQALIQMKFEGNGDLYVDNIFFWKTPSTSVTPTVAAPIPTKEPANVLSIFSDTYTNVAGTDFNPNWGQATVTTQTPIAGNNTLSMAGLNYQGVAFGSAVNASTMGFLHIDYYTVNSTSFKTFLISTGPVETPYTHTVPTSGWNSVDIPLSSFSPVALNDLIQMKFDGNGDLYVDNIFFWKTPSASVTPTVAAPIPTKEPANVLSIFSDTYTNVAGTDFNPNWGQATVTTQTPIAGNNTLSMAGLNYQGVAFGSAVNASTMGFLHIDYYTANSTSFKTFLISTGPVETPYTHTVPTSGWNSVDIPLSSFSPVALNDLIQMKFDGNGDLYVDNIFFWKNPSLPVIPTVAAPVPTLPASGVLSIFSDVYTNVASDLNPNWGQTTAVSQIAVAGNNTLRYATFNYQGIQLTNAQDVSSYGSLHLDYYSTNTTQARIFLISPGPVETPFALTVPTTAGWNSVDIPLSSFSPVALNNIIQLKFDGGDGSGDIFMDNIYFHGTGSTSNCPAPPANDFIVNGDFEATSNCWELIAIQAGTSSTIVSNVSNGGVKSARIKTAQAGNPGIKQTRFGIGGIQPNTTYVVKLDIRSDAADPLANGSILNVATFSEPAEGSGQAATRHNLISGEASVPSTWTTRTLTFTSAANVAGGMSLLIELIGGGATTTGTIFIDNVSLKAQ